MNTTTVPEQYLGVLKLTQIHRSLMHGFRDITIVLKLKGALEQVSYLGDGGSLARGDLRPGAPSEARLRVLVGVIQIPAAELSRQPDLRPPL